MYCMFLNLDIVISPDFRQIRTDYIVPLQARLDSDWQQTARNGHFERELVQARRSYLLWNSFYREFYQSMAPSLGSHSTYNHPWNGQSKNSSRTWNWQFEWLQQNLHRMHSRKSTSKYHAKAISLTFHETSRTSPFRRKWANWSPISWQFSVLCHLHRRFFQMDLFFHNEE